MNEYSTFIKHKIDISGDIVDLFEIQDYTDDEWDRHYNIYNEYYENSYEDIPIEDYRVVCIDKDLPIK